MVPVVIIDRSGSGSEFFRRFRDRADRELLARGKAPDAWRVFDDVGVENDATGRIGVFVGRRQR